MQVENTLSNRIINLYAPFRRQTGTVTHLIQGHTFELDERYQPMSIIGNGAYGCVIQALDKQTNQPVAIKKVEKAFEHRLYAKRTLRELKILRLMRHDNIVELKEVLLPASREQFYDIYMVTDLLEADLSQVIKSDQALSDDHMQLFIYQVLRGLKFLHTAGILHRDLKPRNLLLNRTCDVKICDFGLGRMLQENATNVQMTYYVETRWYRAPELLFGAQNYTAAIDLWSVGCILAEMITRRPFLRGESTRHQIRLIFELLGTPDDSYVNQFSDEVRDHLKGIIKENGPREGVTIEKIFKNQNPVLIDLLKGLLTLDYRKRLTVHEALQHPFLQVLHSEEDEPSSAPANSLEFEFEKYELTREQLKGMPIVSFPGFQKLTFQYSTVGHISNLAYRPQ